MGMRMLGGREFDERDRAGVSTPIVVNERFAKRYLPPGIEPVGTSFVGNGGTVFQIIGVVANSASIGLRDLDQYMLYVPGGRGVLHVRSAVPPATLVGVVRAAVERIDPQVPVFDVRTISEQMDWAIGRERMFASLSVTFAAQALLLSSLGLFGVMASAVSRRTKELGIRLALGAAPSILVRSVLREAAALAACGALLGLPVAWLMARAIRGLFFGIGANDWQSLAFAMAVLAAVAAAAAWIPARRASRVDPLIALRSE
jgi:putative ABC transport system permease protein